MNKKEIEHYCTAATDAMDVLYKIAPELFDKLAFAISIAKQETENEDNKKSA